MVKLLRFSVYHPRLLLVLVALLTITASLFIPRVRLNLDARSLVPANDPALSASDAATSLFGLRDVVVVGVSDAQSGIYTPATLMQVRRLSNEMSAVDGIIPSSVTSIATVPSLTIKDNQIDMRPLLSGGSNEPGWPERIRQEVEGLGLNNGILVSSEGKAAAIFSELRTDANREVVLQQVRALTTRDRETQTSIFLSGTGLAQAVLGQASAADLIRLVPMVIIVLGVALAIAFKHPLPAMVSLLEIGISIVVTMGLLGLSGQPVFVTTLVLPVILVSVGVSDDVYALRHYMFELKTASGEQTEEYVIRVFGSLIQSISLTTISTAVGLLSLAVTGLEPLKVFGVFGTLAIAFSTLLTFSLVPALLVLVGPRAFSSGRASSHQTSRLASCFGWLTLVRSRWTLVIAVVLTAVAGLLTTRLRIDDSWIKNLPTNSDVRLGDQALNRMLAGTTTVDLMIDSGEQNGFLRPQLFLYMESIEQTFLSLPDVGATQSIYNDVMRVNASLRGMSYQAYRTALRNHELELRSGEIEQALHLLAVTRRTSLDESIDRDYQRIRMTVFIREADYKRIEQVLQVAFAAGRNVFKSDGRITPFGDGWISYTTVRVLVEGQTRSVGLALMTDLLLLTLLWRSIKAALIAIIPVAFSVLIVFASLALSGIPLGIANSMFTGITIGIGLDFAIHLTAVYQRSRRSGVTAEAAMSGALSRVGPAVVTSAAAITSGFAVLIFSRITPNAQLGLMICLSLTVCAVASLCLIPGIVLARSGVAAK